MTRLGSDTGALIGAAVHDADGHLVKLCEGGTVSKSASDCTASGGAATTLALTWNALDQLSNATRTGANPVVESHLYDEQNRRIRSTSAGVSTSNLYSGDAIHAQWSGSTLSGNPAAVMVHGAGIDEPVLRLTGSTINTAATQAAYLQDGLGSAVGTVNTAGAITSSQRFDAWGNKTAGTGTVPQYGFTGREPDASGLVHYRARYYHPGIGRFTSRDPMGMVDAVSGYAYVGNNPANQVDPFGTVAMDPLTVAGVSSTPNYWSSGPSIATATLVGSPALAAGASALPGVGSPAGAGALDLLGGLRGGVFALPLLLTGSTQNSEPYKYITYTRENPSTGQVYSGRSGGYGDPLTIASRRAAGQPLLTPKVFSRP